MTARHVVRLIGLAGLCAAWLFAAGLVSLSAQQGQAPAGQPPAGGQGAAGGRGGRGGAGGQGRGGGAPQPPPPQQSPRAAAPADLTGYWVAVLTEDWRVRMVTAPKGDTNSVPLNPAGVAAAAAWDPAADIAAGEQCKAYGAAGVMRLPIRLHITWQDDTTLKIDIDNGTQARLFHFDRNAQGGFAARTCAKEIYCEGLRPSRSRLWRGQGHARRLHACARIVTSLGAAEHAS